MEKFVDWAAGYVPTIVLIPIILGFYVVRAVCWLVLPLNVYGKYFE